MIETFTVAEAAQALGKGELTLRRWIETDILPAPVLVDAIGRAKLYSKGELEVIAKALAKHSTKFQYLCETHDHVRHEIHQHMQAYRSVHI